MTKIKIGCQFDNFYSYALQCRNAAKWIIFTYNEIDLDYFVSISKLMLHKNVQVLSIHAVFIS